MSHPRTLASILLGTFVLLACASCASTTDNSERTLTVTGDLRTPYQVQIDNFVRRQTPAIYVAPTYRADHRPRAIFVPLRCTQQVANAVSFSEAISRQVWQIWLSLNAFEVLEFTPQPGPFNPESALAYARSRGAELVVGGYITHYMDGGDGGESSASLTIEIYDVESGVQIWQMAQGGMMEARQTHDFYLIKIRERNPADAAGFVVRSLAWDMGRYVLAWVDPTAVPREKSILERLLTPKAF